jgi:hypothetical protein
MEARTRCYTGTLTGPADDRRHGMSVQIPQCQASSISPQPDRPSASEAAAKCKVSVTSDRRVSICLEPGASEAAADNQWTLRERCGVWTAGDWFLFAGSAAGCAPLPKKPSAREQAFSGRRPEARRPPHPAPSSAAAGDCRIALARGPTVPSCPRWSHRGVGTLHALPVRGWTNWHVALQ